MSRFVGRLLNCSVFIVFLKSTERLALVGTALVLFLFPFHSNAQIDNNFFNGGGIRVGDSTTACAGNGGGIRFDADSSDGGGLQYCDGTSWLDILTGTITGDVSQGGNSFAAPMIIGTNDNNTLAFETNGSTRMTIDTSGNVGIGTTSPAAKLDVAGGVKVDNDADTCNASKAGTIRWTGSAFEGCDGSSWASLSGGGGGGGRTSCPAGFTLIGTSGELDAFCISTNEETSNNWLSAVTACYNKSPKARLCTASEWAMACVDGTPNNMTGNWEWVADLYGAYGQVMGLSGCNSFGNSAVRNSYASRCCFR